MLPSAGFAAPDAADIAMNSLTTPRFQLLVLSALLLFVPLAHAVGLSDPFGLPKSTLLLVGAVSLLVDASMRALRGGHASRPPRVAVILATLFLAAAGLAAALSPNRALAWRGFLDDLALLVIAWGASGVARDPGRVAWLLRATLLASALVSAGTLAQVFVPGWQLAVAGWSLLPASAAGSTLGDPGLVAQFLVLGLPFGIAAAATARGLGRLAAGVALGIVAAALVFVGRPEGWAAGALVVAVVVLTRVARALRTGEGWSDLTPDPLGSAARATAVVILVAITVTALGHLPALSAPAASIPRIGLLAPTTGDPAADRVAAVRGTLALLGLHPLGVGPGYWRHAFLEVAWTRVPASPFTLAHQAVHAGNSLLELAAETGILGGVLFAALLAVAVVTAAKTALARDVARGDAAKAALDTLFAVAVVAMLGSVFQEGPPALVAFVAIGLAFPALPLGTGAAPRRAPAAGGLVAALAIAGVAAVTLVPRYQAARWTFAGQALLSAGDAEASLRALDRPVVADSPEHLPRALLGNAASRAGRSDRAAAEYGAVLERSPWFIAAYLGRAAAFTDLGLYDKADADLRSALALWPDNPATVLQLGRLDARRGRLDPALVELRRAAELDPSQADAWIAIGEIEMRLNREEAAVEAFRIAAQRSPRHPRVNLLIGEALERRGLLEMALAYFQKAASIDPIAVEPRIRTANVLNALGRICEARDAVAAARDLENDEERRARLDEVIDRLEPKCSAERARRP